MATLLIGGGGLIGSRLVKRLISDGEPLIVYSGHPPANPVDGCQYFQGDVNELGSLLRAIEPRRIDCVIHNAGISSPMLFRDNPYKVYHTNVGGVLASLEAARTCQAKRYIYISTAGVYDPEFTGKAAPCRAGSPDRPYDPEFTGKVDETVPRRANLPYRASKVACEELVRNYDIPETVSLRVSYVYGPGRTVSCPIRQLVAEIITRGSVRWEHGRDQKLDMIHVSDTVEGIARVAAAAQIPEREYNLGGGALIGFDRIVSLASRVFPDKSIQLGAGDLGFSSSCLNMARFKRDFGWQPDAAAPRFEQLLLEYIDWIRRDITAT